MFYCSELVSIASDVPVHMVISGTSKTAEGQLIREKMSLKEGYRKSKTSLHVKPSPLASTHHCLCSRRHSCRTTQPVRLG